MARPRKCFHVKCQKEITGKYYLITGLGGFDGSRKSFCPTCCEYKKQETKITKSGIKDGTIVVIEKEFGNPIDDEISEFEDKWEKCNLGKEFGAKNPPEKEIVLARCQEYHQELEPYLQKLDIVEKSFEGEANNNDIPMRFCYLFDQSAQKEEYRKEVVEITIAKILGVEKLDQEINTVNTCSDPTVPGSAGGQFKIDGKLIGRYEWLDHDGDCRRICFSIDNHKLGLECLLRVLKIKEKELKGDNSPSQDDNNQPNKDGSTPGKPNKPSKDEKDLTKEQKEKVKQYYNSNNIRFITLTPKNILMICYENKNKDIKWKKAAEWTEEEKLIQNYLKKQAKETLTRQDIQNWGEVTGSTPTNSPSPPNWTLIISLSIIGVILLVGLIIFLRRKKKNQIK